MWPAQAPANRLGGRFDLRVSSNSEGQATDGAEPAQDVLLPPSSALNLFVPNASTLPLPAASMPVLPFWNVGVLHAMGGLRAMRMGLALHQAQQLRAYQAVLDGAQLQEGARKRKREPENAEPLSHQGRWNSTEQSEFLNELARYVNNHERLGSGPCGSMIVVGRTSKQVRTHAQKFFLRAVAMNQTETFERLFQIKHGSRGEDDVLFLLCLGLRISEVKDGKAMLERRT